MEGVLVDGAILAPDGNQIASFQTRTKDGPNPVRCANIATEWARKNEAENRRLDEPNKAAKLMHFRSRLAYLTGDAVQVVEQR
jgi:hypothetical protein